MASWIGRNIPEAAKRLARRTIRAVRRHAAIVVYHRIESVAVDPWELAVTPAHFGEHLEVLRRKSRPLPLRELADAVREGKVPNDAVAVTFDDGYADNFRNARPRLEAAGIPATMFLVAGALGRPDAFWWDELADLLLRPGSLPRILELEIGEVFHRFDLGEAAIYTEEDAELHHSWRGWKKEAPTPRHRTYRELFRILQPLPAEDRSSAIARIRSRAQAPLDGARGGRAMTPDEAAVLARGGLVDVGAHTMTHPRLSALSEPGQRSEIAESRTRLEEIVGSAVTSFAYPYGQRGDYGDDSVGIVRDAGFDVACANVPGPVTGDSDLLQLPRFHVSDGDGDSFARRWAEWRG